MVRRPRSALAALFSWPVNLASQFPLLYHDGVVLCGLSGHYGLGGPIKNVLGPLVEGWWATDLSHRIGLLLRVPYFYLS